MHGLLMMFLFLMGIWMLVGLSITAPYGGSHTTSGVTGHLTGSRLHPMWIVPHPASVGTVQRAPPVGVAVVAAAHLGPVAHLHRVRHLEVGAAGYACSRYPHRWGP